MAKTQLFDSELCELTQTPSSKSLVLKKFPVEVVLHLSYTVVYQLKNQVFRTPSDASPDFYSLHWLSHSGVKRTIQRIKLRFCSLSMHLTLKNQLVLPFRSTLLVALDGFPSKLSFWAYPLCFGWASTATEKLPIPLNISGKIHSLARHHPNRQYNSWHNSLQFLFWAGFQIRCTIPDHHRPRKKIRLSAVPKFDKDYWHPTYTHDTVSSGIEWACQTILHKS